MNRLSKKEIKRIFLNGYRIEDEDIVLICDNKRSSATTTNGPGFAVLVSKKAAKKAHERNYIKRVFRESIRAQKTQLLPKRQYVFLQRTQPTWCSFFTVSKKIKTLVKAMNKERLHI